MLATFLVSLVGAGASQTRMLQTVPAYFWSGMPMFNDGVVTDYVPASALWQTLEGITGVSHDGATVIPLKATESPEVVLAFNYDKLDADLLARDPSLSRIEGAMSCASSSLSVPYVYNDGPTATSVKHHVCCSKAATYLAESGVLSDGVSDLVMVDVDGSVESDALVNSVVKMVNEATQGRYVAMMTANKTAASPDLTLEFAPKEGRSRRRLSYADTQQRQIPLTPAILTGLLVGGLLLIILISGFCCLYGLQTPKNFETE